MEFKINISHLLGCIAVGINYFQAKFRHLGVLHSFLIAISVKWMYNGLEHCFFLK